MTGTIPPYLTDLDRWILWQNVIRAGKQTKIPISVRGGPAADVTDPRNWGSHAFCAAARVRTQGAWDGEGIVLGDLGTGEALVGLDLDSCLVDGRLAEWARPYLDALDTYAEVSPSGVGLKLFFRVSQAELPTIRAAFAIPPNMNGRKKTYPNGNGNGTGEAHGPAAEIYLSHRFFTVTGRQWHEAGEHVALIGLDAIRTVAALFGPRETTIAGSDDIGDATAPAPEALRAKLAGALRDRPYLAERWLGIGTGLTDTSRSGFDMSLGSMLKAAGFTYGEMRAAILANPHGAGPEHANDERYFERIWSRSVVPARPPEPEPPPWVTDQPGWETPDPEEQAPPRPEIDPRQERKRKVIITMRELDALPPPEWLVEGLLPEGGMIVPFGPPKSGKTFVVLSLGLHIAAGREWFGRKVKAGAVVYISGEGTGGLATRLGALRTYHDIDIDAPFWIIPRAVNFRQDAEVAALIALLRATVGETPLRMVVIDTLARAMPGADENSAQDVGLVIAGCDELREELGCAVAPIHHSGKDSARGARGTSALRGAWDTALEIVGSARQTTVTVVDQKEAEGGQRLTFKMERVDLADGRHSLVPVLLEPKDDQEDITAPLRRREPTGHTAVALQCLRNLMAGPEAAILPPFSDLPSGDVRGINHETWRRAVYEKMPGETTDKRRNSFWRASQRLQELRFIGVRDPWVWLI